MSYTYGSITNCKVKNGQTRKEYECRLGYQVNSQSIENNTSNITLRLQVRSKDSAYKTSGKGQTTKIDGTTVASNKKFDMSDKGVWQTFGSKTMTVTHNSDGTYSASKSGSFTATAGTSEYSLRSGSAKVTVKPKTIPRASSFSLNTYNLALSDVPDSTANNLVVYIDRKSSSFTHTVEIKISSYTKSYYNVGTQVTWGTYYDIWQNFPNNVGSLGATVTVYTYNGSTYIGSNSISMSFFLSPAYCTPEAITSSGQLDNITQELTGSVNTVIKGFSVLSYNGTARTKKYGYLNKVIVTGGNNIRQSATLGEPSTVDEERIYNYSGNLRGIETKDISIAITDTRGITINDTLSFRNIKEYFKPTITKFELIRLDNHLSRGGEPDETGTATKLVIEGTLWKENFGTVINSMSSVSCQYKGGTIIDYTDIKKPDNSSITVNDFTFEGNNFSLEIDVKGDILQDNAEEGIFYGFSVENTFDFKLNISDILYPSAEVTTILEKGQPYIEITDGEDGEGLIDFKVPLVSRKNIDIGESSDTNNRGIGVKNGHFAGSMLSNYNGSTFGLWSITNDKWVIRDNSSNEVYIDGDRIAIDTSGNVYLRSPKAFLKGVDNGGHWINLIRAYGDTGMTAIGDSGYETGIWGTALRIYPSSYFSNYVQFNDSIDVNANLYVNDHPIRAKYIYDRDTVTNSPNMYITSNGWIRRTTNTSSERYKTDIKDLEEELNPNKLYDLNIKQFRYKNEYQPNENDKRYNKNLIGFIAEDVERVYPIAVDYTEDGQVDNWNERYIIPAMLKLIQDQKKEIDELKNRVSALENIDKK